MSHPGPWMTCFWKFPCGTVLREGDAVGVFHSRLDRGRFSDVEIDRAMSLLPRLRQKAGDDSRRMPVIVTHCGRLFVVERASLTNQEPAPRPVLVEPGKPAKQKALF